MRIKKFQRYGLPRRITKAHVKRVWTNKWVRRIGMGILCLGFYQAGAGTEDPRMEDNLPGLSVPEESLYGKWDGIGTLPNGTVFCMTQWPCEDDILNTPGAGK